VASSAPRPLVLDQRGGDLYCLAVADVPATRHDCATFRAIATQHKKVGMPGTDSNPAISVITVTYNSASDFVDRAPVAQGFEWIVVDNASVDNSADLAERLGARVLRNEENRGFSAANNAGARAALGDVLVFCNPDVHFDAPGLARLAEETTARRAVIAPQLLNADGSMQENARGVPYPHRKLRHFFAKQRPGDVDQYLFYARPGQIREIVWAIGAAVAIPTSDFWAIGGWNERYFIYYEDSDFCLRARERGLPVLLDGSTRWFHRWDRATRKKFSWRAWRSEFRSAFIFYVSHPHCVLPVGARARRLLAVERRSRTEDAASDG